MAAQAATIGITEPFPIFTLAHRYLLYDIDVVSYIRREYNICGVLIGSLPQAPQQNVFLGLPVELLPEEARLLVEKGVAHVVDDVVKHKQSFLSNGLSPEERKAYQAALRKQGVGAAKEANKRTHDRKKTALKQKLDTEDWNDIPEDMLRPKAGRKKRDRAEKTKDSAETSVEESYDTLFTSTTDFAPSQPTTSRTASIAGSSTEPEPYAITPTTSYPQLQSAPLSKERYSLPKVPPSYPLYKHLHTEGYFLAPGLRFGCQYMAYPGDPLRFHSHFLVNGMDWDQEFDLLDLVGGGRLGTGVKKAFLIGGQEEGGEQRAGGNAGGVKAFCIEWGGM